jgi:hypothetical protein
MRMGKFLKYLIYIVVVGNLALAAYVFLGAFTPATPKPASGDTNQPPATAATNLPNSPAPR